MKDLLYNDKSVFIKKRNIHDNFLYVKKQAKKSTQDQVPGFIIQAWHMKVFDSVRWEYILDLLENCGLPSIFWNRIYALLSTSISRVLLNSVAGLSIKHGCGVHQGDPLSPLNFVLTIERLTQINPRHRHLHMASFIKLVGVTLFWVHHFMLMVQPYWCPP
jgi:hypothetical protein